MTDYQQYIDILEKKFHNPENESVSPFERVDLAINRKQPDRTPVDFWAVNETIEKLLSELHLDNVEQVLQLLGVDCRIVSPLYIGPKQEILPDGSFYNVFGSHRKKVVNEFSTYEEYASFPLASLDTAAQIESYSRWPDISYWDWGTLPEIINEVNKDVRYHIRYDVGGIFETAWGLYGLDKFLVDLIQNPEAPLAILDCVTNILIENFKQAIKHADGLIDMVYTYDDVAIQNGLLMSKKMWRKNILPFHQKLNKEIKKHDVKILYHSCGAIYDLIDPIIDEMHIDMLNPLQPRAVKMDMQNIKDTFGGRVAFHGAVDIQHTMPFGTTQEVTDEVRARCQILGKGGGYVCTTAHYIQGDTPVENILALYAADRSAN
jgi:uroporphyrinogen decarboxylase